MMISEVLLLQVQVQFDSLSMCVPLTFLSIVSTGFNGRLYFAIGCNQIQDHHHWPISISDDIRDFCVIHRLCQSCGRC